MKSSEAGNADQVKPPKFSPPPGIEIRRPPLQNWQGRTRELDRIHQWIEAGEGLIGVTASGGYGKSTLIAKVWREFEEDAALAARFERQIWVSFSGVCPFAPFATWLWGEVTGEGLPPGTEAVGNTLANALAGGRYLLVLDNFETLVDAAGVWVPGYREWLLDILEGGGESVVLLTSRERLELPNNLRGRWLRLVGLPEAEGVALLEKLGVGGNAADLAEMARKTDGHPLLLTLVAGFLRAEFGEEPCIEWLKGREYDLFALVGRHRGDSEASLKAILTFSFDRLSEELRGLLLQLWKYPTTWFNLRRINDSYANLQATEAQCRQLANRSVLQERCRDGVWEFGFQPLIREYLQQAMLEFYDSTGDNLGKANTLKAIGKLQTDPDAALDYYQRAHTLYVAIEDRYSQALNFLYLAEAQQERGDLPQAIESLTQAATLAAAISFTPLQNHAQNSLAKLQHIQAKPLQRGFPRWLRYSAYGLLGLAIAFLVAWILNR